MYKCNSAIECAFGFGDVIAAHWLHLRHTSDPHSGEHPCLQPFPMHIPCLNAPRFVVFLQDSVAPMWSRHTDQWLDKADASMFDALSDALLAKYSFLPKFTFVNFYSFIWCPFLQYSFLSWFFYFVFLPNTKWLPCQDAFCIFPQMLHWLSYLVSFNIHLIYTL